MSKEHDVGCYVYRGAAGRPCDCSQPAPSPKEGEKARPETEGPVCQECEAIMKARHAAEVEALRLRVEELEKSRSALFAEGSRQEERAIAAERRAEEAEKELEEAYRAALGKKEGEAEKEDATLRRMQTMCEESLSPHDFEAWTQVRGQLIARRPALHPEDTP
jgi:hypothetical protein